MWQQLGTGRTSRESTNVTKSLNIIRQIGDAALVIPKSEAGATPEATSVTATGRTAEATSEAATKVAPAAAAVATSTLASSSLALAAALAHAGPASASTYDVHIDCIRLATTGILTNIVCHRIAVPWVARQHIISMEEKTVSIVVVDKAKTLLVIEELDRSRSTATASHAASHAAPEAAAKSSSLAFAAALAKSWSAAASTDDINIDRVQFTTASILADVVTYLVAIARVA